MNLFCVIFFTFLVSTTYLKASNVREGRITGGSEARPHSNPYVVSLQSRFLWGRYRVCTGSILSERWILSAGHCVLDSWAKWFPMDAIIGAHNLARISYSMIYPISHRIAHPKYRGGVGPYDISMMRTSRDIQFSDTVQPISLPTTNTDQYSEYDDLLITGWGALQSNFFISEFPNKLQEAKVSYLRFYDCFQAVNRIKDSYESNPLRRYHNFCTGPIYSGVAGCTGDSGGPLVRYIPIPGMTELPEITTEEEETTTTTERAMSSTQMSTDTPTTTETTMSPLPVTTNRPSTTTTESTMSPMPVSTNRPTTSTSESTTDESTITTETTVSPIPMTTNRPSTTASSTTAELTTTELTTPTTEMITAETTTTSDIDTETPINDALGRLPNLTRNNQQRAMLMGNIMPTVVGVMSWGVVPCGYKGAPTVYSNVSNYMEFINKYLNS